MYNLIVEQLYKCHFLRYVVAFWGYEITHSKIISQNRSFPPGLGFNKKGIKPPPRYPKPANPEVFKPESRDELNVSCIPPILNLETSLSVVNTT